MSTSNRIHIFLHLKQEQLEAQILAHQASLEANQACICLYVCTCVMKLGTSVMFELASNCVFCLMLWNVWMMAWLICMSCDENVVNICDICH